MAGAVNEAADEIEYQRMIDASMVAGRVVTDYDEGEELVLEQIQIEQEFAQAQQFVYRFTTA